MRQDKYNEGFRGISTIEIAAADVELSVDSSMGLTLTKLGCIFSLEEQINAR